MNTLTIILLMILSTFIGSIGSLFLKTGSHNFHIKLTIKGIIDMLKNWRIIGGLLLYLLSTIVFISILKTEDLSLVYPLSSMTYIFIALFSAYFLNERINMYKIFGIILIIFGVAITTV